MAHTASVWTTAVPTAAPERNRLNIPAATLKSLLKKLSSVRSELVLLDTAAGTLFAADNDIRLWVESPALKDESGAVLTVNGRRLSSAVSRLSGVLSVTHGKKGLTVASAKTRFDLEVTPGKLDPRTAEKGATYTLPLAETKALLKAGAIITQKGHASYSDIVELRGDTVLRVRATNERRLAVIWGGPYEGEAFQHLIPVSVIGALQEIPGESAVLTVSDALVTFSTTDDQETRVIVSARRSAKQFPDFDGILPKTFAHEVKVDAAAMREALARVAPFIPATDLKTVLVTFPGSEVQVSASNGGVAVDAVPQIDPASTEDDPFAETPAAPYRLHMNHTYLSDFFQAAEGTVTIGLNTHPKPVWMDAGKTSALFTLQVPA
jgi:DNA polymerase III sliding clamp (beta) subunit (PCNA family)